MAEKSAKKTLLGVKEMLGSSLRNSDFLHGISKQWTSYEKRVKSLVKDLDLKSRDARDKSRKQLDVFANQLQKTKVDVEKKVVSLVNYEAGRLNQGFNELVTYLKSLSTNEKLAKPATKGKSKAKSPAKRAPSSKGKKSTGRAQVVSSRKSDSSRSSISSSGPVAH